MIKLGTSAMISAVGDEYVLLDSLNGHYYSLDHTGRRMLDLALEEKSEEAVVDKLNARYDVDPQQLQDDFSRLIAELADIGLVVVTADEK